MASSTPIAAAAPANLPFLVRLCDDIRLSIFDGVAFSRPTSLSAAAARCRRNITSFPINYFNALSFFGNPLTQLLTVLWLVFYLLRPSYSPPLFAVDGRPVSDGIVGLVVLALIHVVFCPLTVRSLLTCSHLAALAVVVTHATLRVPDESPIDEQAPRADGHLPRVILRTMEFVLTVTGIWLISSI